MMLLVICFLMLAADKLFLRSASNSNVLQYVDPLIGTSTGGHVFPGANLPFGMAKAGPDVLNDNQGGFATTGSDNRVYGFSHMHDSGTGGSSSLGNFPLFPQICPNNNISACPFPKFDRATDYDNSSLVATPGYFSIKFKNGIQSEMTTTNHTALYRFSFPSTTPEGIQAKPLILADLIDLPPSQGLRDISVDPSSGRILGNGSFNPSFGLGNYQLYSCMDFKGAEISEVGTFDMDMPQPAHNLTKYVTGYISGGAYIQFHQPSNNQILVRVGLSFISLDQACLHAENEIPDYGFQAVQDQAVAAWNAKFSVIQIDAGGADPDLLTSFWSGIYRALISPQDYTGVNPLFDSSTVYYDSYYCIWDSFRSTHPLLTVIDPYSQSAMVQSLLNIYKKEGWMPDCRMSLDKGYTQGGSNADIVVVDAYVKSLPAIDWNLAYQAVVKDAEVEPDNWGVEGRGNLQSWNEVNYVPYLDENVKGEGLRTRSISRTVEYAYDDFCIAEFAKGLGNTAGYNRYINHTNYWKNLYKEDEQSFGFSGFLQPKRLDGSWDYQDPTVCSPLNDFDGCYLNAGGKETYEGSPWLYTFFVPGDMASLVKTLGGRDNFTERLDYLHESGLLYVGDEQSFLTVFLYHYVGRPGKSSERTHFYIPSQFNTSLNGIPGNDDSGAMGSFSCFSMMGVWPNAGQNVYLITPPYFRSISILNQVTGKTATIKNVNFDPTYKSIYIQSAKYNGQPYTKNWIDHSFFLNGDTLELTLGPTESEWGTRDEDLPPSLSTTGIILGKNMEPKS